MVSVDHDFVPPCFFFLMRAGEDGGVWENYLFTCRRWIGNASKNSCATSMVYSDGSGGMSAMEW